MKSYRRALIVGCGRSGRAAEALLRAEGCQTVAVSKETTPDYRFESLGFVPDVAVVSPGFAPEHPWLRELAERGVPLISELELGWSRRTCPVVAVTGSNGKSTVVKWIAEAIGATGLRAVPCGNYGFPVCDAVRLDPRPDWLVIEVSSFQLETVLAFRPEVGVLLNVLPNHLDRHGTIEAYRDMKMRLFACMGPSDTAVIAHELLAEVRPASPCRVVSFGTQPGAEVRFAGGRAGKADLRGTRFDNEILGAAGAAVAAVCAACGVPPEAVESSARGFVPLPHRTATVAELRGVRYVDDSKATNLAAMCAAVRMFPDGGTLHLIAGGRPKERDFSLAKDLLAQRGARLYLIGEASGMMQAAWGEAVRCVSCGTLETAVRTAYRQAVPGDTVLLSPACTSFDQFKDFNERGDCFAALVCGLAAEEKQDC